MPNGLTLSHEFVEFVPADLKEGTLYISIPYKTMVHRCCCGCGGKVVTRLSPRHWKLTFDGEAISLRPSIGNWNFECRSHYWIERGRVRWDFEWTDEEIATGQAKEESEEQRYLATVQNAPKPTETKGEPELSSDTRPSNFWQKLKKWALAWLR